MSESEKPKKITNAELAASVAAIAESMKGLESKLAELSARKDPASSAPKLTVETMESAHPVPQEYREIVDMTLNAHFGIEVSALPDRPAFMLAIVVPESYTNTTKAWRDMYGTDRRSRIISYAEGSMGVREWADKVFNNFDQDTRTRITIDRQSVKQYAS